MYWGIMNWILAFLVCFVKSIVGWIEYQISELTMVVTAILFCM